MPFVHVYYQPPKFPAFNAEKVIPILASGLKEAVSQAFAVEQLHAFGPEEVSPHYHDAGPFDTQSEPVQITIDASDYPERVVPGTEAAIKHALEEQIAALLPNGLRFSIWLQWTRGPFIESMGTNQQY